MTFVKDLLSKSNNNENDNNENIGFKCTNHNSIKINKFRYYCLYCKENICKECSQNHLENKHELIVFDFKYFEFFQKINEINKYLNLKKKN